jgi:hypothetical protein
VALSHPTHQRVPHEGHMGQAASRWAVPCITLIMPKGITKDILVSTI